MTSRTLFALGLAAAVAIPASAGAKTLVFCSEGSPEGFNPQLYTSGTTFDATASTIYNRLVEFERGTTNTVPGLAESWTISEDGTVYTFKLRRGVKFHTTPAFTPSRDFNADDVAFSFERMWKKEHPYNKVSGGTYEYFSSTGWAKLLKAIDKLDASTVRITLNEPSAPFFTTVAMQFASILSAEYADKMLKAGTPEKVDVDPVGTGPFVRTSYQKDATIRYQANPSYWAGPAKIDTLVFAITPDRSVAYAKLKAGECHVIPYPNPADIAAMQADPNITVLQKEGINVGYWAFNTEKKPFDDKRVRQALNLAVNKQAIIDSVFQKAGKIAKNPLPPSFWSYNDKIQDYPYDPARAKKLLADAGHPNGFETELWAMPVARPYNPDAKRMAELMQADLAKVGVKAKIVTFEWGEYLKRSVAGEHTTLLLGWTADIADPDNFLYVLLGCDAAKNGTNRARWCHKPFDDLVTQAQRITDRAKRIELYEKAQVVFKEEAPWLTIAHSIVSKPVRKEVIDFRIDPFGAHNFYGVDLK